MPAHYAHYRFGKQALALVSPDVRQCIQRFRRMYDLGLNGPDFFFYYYPFLKTETRQLGKVFHRQSGQEFFSNACKAATSEAARAYLYGLLGHYCLDALCHPYIHQLVQIGEAKHVPLESELERQLLVLDGEKDPHTFDLSKKMKPTRGECMTIAEFYPGATGAAVSQSFGSMAFHVRLLANPSRAGTVKLFSKFYPSLPEHGIPEEASEELLPYISELQALYEEALQQYPILLAQLTAHLQEGEPLGEAFAPIFG